MPTAASPLTSTLDDWEASVCAKNPTPIGASALPNATRSEGCFSPNQNPILIGSYSSTAAMQDDIARVPYDAPYATIVDKGSGEAWMFVAFEGAKPGETTRRVLDPNYQPTAPVALSPLTKFGFQMHHLGK